MSAALFITYLVFGSATINADPHVRRYALVMAANHGGPDEPALRYAQLDAERVARTLTDVAGVAPNAITTLRDPSDTDVRAQFRALRRRVSNETRDGSESLLFVYYSGHADAMALHLGSTTLPWAELLRLTREVDVTARVLLVDSCRSGALTELKGLSRDAPIILPEQQDLPKGVAIMTSASAGEGAQESRDLQGSFFTHHFIAALRGVADTNKDGRVTLNEAFAYASLHTSQSTSATLLGVQHATYRFALQGRRELILTVDHEFQAGATVHLTEPGTYVFRYDGPDGDLALEATVGHSPRTLVLPFGHYDVRRRTSSRLYHGDLVVDKAHPEGTEIAMLMDDRPDAVLSKGAPTESLDATVPDSDEDSAPSVWSVEGFAGTGTSLLPHFKTPGVFGVGVARRTGPLVLEAQFNYVQASAVNGVLQTNEYDVGATLGARYMFWETDLFALSAGGRLGALYVLQHYSAVSVGTFGVPPASGQVVPLMQPLVRGELRLPAGLFLSCEAGARLALMQQVDASNVTTTHFAASPLVTLGVGASW